MAQDCEEYKGMSKAEASAGRGKRDAHKKLIVLISSVDRLSSWRDPEPQPACS